MAAAARAQQGERMRVVGVLDGYSAEDREAQARRVADAADIERDIASFAHVPGGGLVLPPDVTTTLLRRLRP